MRWLAVLGWSLLLPPTFAIFLLVRLLDVVRAVCTIVAQFAILPYGLVMRSLIESWAQARYSKVDRKRRAQLDRLLGRVRRARRGGVR